MSKANPTTKATGETDAAAQEDERQPMKKPPGGWPADEFTGKPGHYVRDPYTGKRSPAPGTQTAGQKA